MSYKYLIFCLAFFLGTFLVPFETFAQNAALYLAPESGMYTVGEPFTIEIRVNTGGQSVGTSDATIAYDSDDISFVSVSDEGSIFNTILVDSSRENGKVDISGFIEGGGKPFIGLDGLFARVTFLPKRNVATQVYFSKGAATEPLPLTASIGSLVNDVLSDLRLQTASYTFVPKESVPATVLYATAQGDFEITPLPVPSNEWFSTTSVKLSWTLPEGISEMRTLVSSNPDATPDKVYPMPVNSIDLTNLKEGTNYFLLQFKLGSDWGSVIQHPLKIDITSPEYLIVKEAERVDDADPHVSFVVESKDVHSGVGWYEMSIDGSEPQKWEQINNGTYQPEGLTPGEHVLTAMVFDKAGNSTSTDFVFLVRSLEAPVLDNASVPERVLTGDAITVRGTSYPNSDITVYVSYNDGEAIEKKVKSDDTGAFVVTVTEGARAGKYTLWFLVTDERGAMSPNSIKRSIEVSQPYIMLFGSKAVTYLSVIVPLVGLILLLVLVLWLGYTWIQGYRRRVKFETNEAYHTTQDEFTRLREELITQIGMLEKANQSRELTREEMRIFTDLSKRLDKMEEHIIQEIEDVETVQEDVHVVKRVRTIEGSLERYKNSNDKNNQVYDSSHTIRL
jgi:hypothetical protein